jgi:hypothetical protein
MVEVRVEITPAEFREYRRLLQFANDINSLAAINSDDELQGLVDQLRHDLQAAHDD